MDELEDDLDYLIVDTGAGISDNVLYFNMAAQERLVVLTPEPTSLTDAYALIKVLKTNHGVERFRVCVNMAPDQKTAKEMFVRLALLCQRTAKPGITRRHGSGAGHNAVGCARES